jgi:Tfp pilus assembly protein PilF
MPSRIPSIVCLSAILLTSVARAQHAGPTTENQVDIQVKVTYEDGRTPVPQLKLELLNFNSLPLIQLFTDKDGRADFIVNLVGTRDDDYYLRATGNDIEQTVSDAIDVVHREGTHMVSLQVKSTTQPAPQSKSAITSVAQAQVSKDARAAFHSGLSEWEKKNYQPAADYFEKATVLYPQYDEAFNYLGMMYAHLDQPEKSRAAFETAVKLNDKNASADRNLAGLMMRDHNYERAGDLARKSLAVDPSNSFAWTVAAIADLQAGNPDLAVKAARKAHESPHEGYALCHFVAGQALERQHDPAGAKLEYETYLKETPDGPEAPKVKQALTHLAAASTQQ